MLLEVYIPLPLPQFIINTEKKHIEICKTAIANFRADYDNLTEESLSDK